jgi:electron transfer flavoprotein alpha/beta subunit
MAFVQHPAFPDDAPLSVDNPDDWAEQGWVVLSEKEAAEVDPTVTARPAGNASREEWIDYAISAGADQDVVANMTRDEIRDTF